MDAIAGAGGTNGEGGTVLTALDGAARPQVTADHADERIGIWLNPLLLIPLARDVEGPMGGGDDEGGNHALVTVP